MSDQNNDLTRRTFIKTVPLGIAGTILLKSTPAEARVLRILFRIGSYGFGGVVAAGLGLGMLALGTASAIGRGSYSSYSGSRIRRSNYSTSTYTARTPSGWKKYVPPKPIVVSVSLDPNKQIAGDILRLRAIEYDILKNDGIVLPRVGRLIIQEDGTMNFADTRFRGYAKMQNNSDLTIWTPDHELVVTRKPDVNKFHNLHHDSHDGRLALVSLLGDIRHA